MSERPFSQGASEPLVVAHRGASAREAENTLAAFEAAVAAGADAVEFDVRLTADRVPVVIHDADLSRTTDRSGLVASMPLDEVRAARIPTGRGVETVPTFREVLDALSGRISIDVELKHLPGEPDVDAGGAHLVAATLDVLADAAFEGDVLVSSFDPFALDRVVSRDPSLATGLLTTRDVDALAGVTFARDRGYRWVLPFIGAATAAGDALTTTAHAAGIRVGTWLTDRPSEAVALFRAGLDAVATNDPEPIVAAVREAFA
ncbi:MAG TPA: glycerophosphodiester phosphodiesterase [Actinomycetota bacterium]|nr:glycerophosphodiester phosphodiesterase [Actinomycetota bacterium]